MVERPGIMIYVDEVLSACSYLSTEQAGRLFLAVLHYGKEGTIPEWEDPVLGVAWSFIQPKLDRDGQKYSERSIKARYATYCREARRADQTPATFEQWRRSVSPDINQSSDDAIRCPTVSASASESVTESVTETVPTREKCVEPPQASAPEPEKPPVIGMILNDESVYCVAPEQKDRWAELFPGVDVVRELRRMAAWLESNPTKRKTRRGIERFITGWLSREQDRCTQAPSRAAVSAWERREGVISDGQVGAAGKTPRTDWGIEPVSLD